MGNAFYTWIVVVLLAAARVEADGTPNAAQLLDRVYFESVSSELDDESARTLDAVAAALARDPGLGLLAVSHSDRRGSAPFNLRLSAARAQSVIDYLVARGIDGSRITITPMGERQPLDARDVADAWAKNRRVDLYAVPLGAVAAGRAAQRPLVPQAVR